MYLFWSPQKTPGDSPPTWRPCFNNAISYPFTSCCESLLQSGANRQPWMYRFAENVNC